MRKFIYVVSAICLSGCVATNAQNFHDSMTAKMKSEEQAIIATDKKVGEICAKGKAPQDIPRKEFVKFNTCATKIYEADVIPIVAYPDLFIRLRATSLENAELYQKGAISFEQSRSRAKVAYLDYLEAVNARANGELQNKAAQDQVERQQFKAMADSIAANAEADIQRQRDSMPKQSTCRMYGNTAHCITQ